MGILEHSEYIIHCIAPLSDTGYQIGMGKKVLVIVRDKTAEAIHKHFRGTGIFCGVLLRGNTQAYSELKGGVVVPLELRGSDAPVIPYAWLQKNMLLPATPKI